MATPIKPSEEVKLNSFPPIEDRLNQVQVAELFGKTVQTIITWKKKGMIPYYQLGKFPIFSKKQLTLVAAKNQHLIKS